MDILNLLGTIHAVGQDMAVLVLDQLQYPAMMFGAAGAWSTDVAMGPWPSLALRDACRKKEWEAAATIAGEMQAPFAHLGLTMEEFQAMQSAWWKVAIEASGYAKAGPARPPFVHIPDRVMESGERYGKEWRALADRYRSTEEEGT
jgi:hydratase-aldolase